MPKQSMEFGKENSELSPLERALTIYSDVGGSRLKFEIAKLLTETENPLTVKEISAQLLDRGLSASPSTASNTLQRFRQGIMVSDKRNSYLATDAARYVVTTVTELANKINSGKVTEETGILKRDIKDYAQLKDLETALTTGNYEKSLTRALSTYYSLTASRTRFELAEIVADAKQRPTFRELRRQAQAKQLMLPGSTQSNLLTEFRLYGIITGDSEAGYEATESGIYALNSMHRLAETLTLTMITEKLKIAENGGASHETLVAYTAALHKKFGLTK